jgi:uncharacterized membrane protein
VAAFVGSGASTRTASGSAVLAQTRGFEEYLTKAEASQLVWEEGEDIYSKYLPWAVVFGCVDRWNRLFADLMAQGRYQPNYYWYYSPYGNNVASIGSSITTMTSSMQSMIQSSSSYASSGGSSVSFGSSGFSGGGGGHGGGGSSSW